MPKILVAEFFYSRPIGVQFGPQWQTLVSYCLEASEQAGYPLNTDHNDGNPVGYSVAQFNVSNATRITSPGAFLNSKQRSRLSNLVVLTQALCTKVVFNGKQAVGVEIVPFLKTDNNERPVKVNVEKEVILTAGTFQSAQLLLLSGVGPKRDLQALGISPVVESPTVGRNIQDHSALACEFIVSPTILGHNQVLNSDILLSNAQKEYKETRSGPLAVFGASACLIFPRLPSVLNSPEKQALDTKTQAFLDVPTRPTTEIWMHSGPLFYTGPCPTDASVLVIEGLNQNCLSKGNMTLRNTDPREPPVIDLQYLAHPYDIRVAVETVREIMKLSRTPALQNIIQTPILAPVGDSEKDLENFVRQNLTQGFHGMGTCVMGAPGDTVRVVNNDFSVVGCSGLRVADMSVCPILTCNHTQVNAYLIAIRCADLLVQETPRHPGSYKM
jgi:choline dehydrogenase-like flavoprotein